MLMSNLKRFPIICIRKTAVNFVHNFQCDLIPFINYPFPFIYSIFSKMRLPHKETDSLMTDQLINNDDLSINYSEENNSRLTKLGTFLHLLAHIGNIVPIVTFINKLNLALSFRNFENAHIVCIFFIK